MNKQPIAWLLAASMSVMQAAPAAAVIASAEQSAETLVSVGNAAGKPGDTVSVSLTLKGNRGLNAMAVWLKYDPDVLEPVNISDKGKFGADAFDAPKTGTDGQIRLGWTNSKKANANDGIIAVIDFKIKDTAAVGEYAVGISTKDGENFTADFNSDDPFTDVELAVDGGIITVTDASGKKSQTSSASAPVVSDVYASGFKIKLPSRYEYACSETELSDFAGVKWSKNPKASGLKPNTEYFVYQRKTGSPEISAPAKVMTSKYDISDVIESVSIGTSCAGGTVLTPVITYRDGFSAEIAGELTYCWSAKSWTGVSVSMAESYTVTAEDAALGREMQVTVAALNCKGFAISNMLTAGVADYSGIVKSPVIKETSSDGFVISAEAGYEYIVSEDGAIPENAAWASLDSDASVTGNAGKTYYVFTRAAGTEAVNASEPSSPVSVKIPSGNASLTNLTVSSGKLTPKFSPDVTDYTVYVPYGRSLPRIKAAVGSSNSTVDFEQAKGFAEGKNTAVITVTAENKTDTKQYTVTFVRQEELEAPVSEPENTDAEAAENTEENSVPEMPHIASNGTVEPCVAGDSEKSGWNAVCNEIAATADGKTVTVKMNDTTELPKEVLEFIQNRDVSLALKMKNGAVWT
ncbi:MAG: cadherin-like beta sandwich domain-containing protein, partial [Oscillospiraceae bacterium]|nr:cadherin-like beta sandwich domain-containing protein [Oscillospiraceae bacterium]